MVHNSKSKYYLRIALLSAALLLCLPLTNLVQVVEARPTGADGDSQTFPQTGKTVSGEFLKYWQEKGGVAVFGLPLSDPRYQTDPQTGQSYLTQYFERNRFELHPGANGSGNQVQLGLLGRELRREALKIDPDFQKVDPLADPDFPADQQQYFPETGHNLRFRFLEYWKQNGGQEQFGLPISEEHLEFEPVSGGYYLTQWFERARFEYHPEKPAPNDVLLGLLGRQLLEYNNSFNFTWKVGRRASYLTDPNSIFVDAKGNIYVNDRAGGRINKYNSSYKLINYWYTNGTSQAIAGIARDSSAKDTPLLYQIGTSQSTRINKLMPDGKWQTVELADAGDSDSLAPNMGLAVDESENFYIFKYGSASGYLVWKYNSKGLFLGKLAKRSETTDPTAFYVSKNSIYIANGSAGNYKIFSANPAQANAPAQNTFSLGGGANNGKTPGALAIAADSQGNVFVGEAGQIDTFDHNGTAGVPFGTPGRGGGQIFNPAGLAIDKDGNLYIADPANHQVSIFDPAGNYKTNLQDKPYNLDGSLVGARGVAVSPAGTGTVLVSDPVNKRVQKFDSTGNFLQKWSAAGISLLAVSPQNEVYGLDTTNGLVIKYDLDGKELAKWDGSASGKGPFKLPGGLAIGPEGNVYVADTGNQRIIKLDSKGTFLASWGAKGAGDGQFGGTGFNNVYDGPTSLAVEPGTGNLYVVDPALYRVQKFSPQGKLLGIISNLATNRAFEPVAVAAAPDPAANKDNSGATPAAAATTKAASTASSGVYILTRDTLYRLDQDGKVVTSITANVLLEGMVGGDTGDGGIGNLTNLAADNSGNLFATDNFGRLVKFRTR